jgi:hypothetical protein
MKKNSPQKMDSRKNKLDIDIDLLLKKNPDIELAYKIMSQSKKTLEPAVGFDQSNYYKIPVYS